MKEPIISVSGLRGVIGESLTPELAARFAGAFAVSLEPGPIVVSRDGRATGEMLVESIRACLRALGRDVLDAGIAATPTTGVLVRTCRARGGIQVSASHNPPEYNGLKLFAATGQVVGPEVGQQVIERYRQGQYPWVSHDRVGGARWLDDPSTAHRELILAIVDVDRIRQRRFRVVLDANHGAGSVLGRQLLSAFDCEWEIVGGTPDGRFDHPPEPTAENLAGISSQVHRFHADVGFCQDPDADRLAVIDESGRYLGEEYTLALCLNHVLDQRPGAIVTNCASSRMSEDLARQYGVPFHRSRVGEAHVTGLMRQTNAVFGGEGNGGPIDPRVGYVRDSFAGMALILDAMAKAKSPVSRLADSLPRYSIHKSKAKMEPARIPAALDTLQHHFANATPDRMDGLRLDWHDRWLLIRASNTEPIVRIIAEAPTAREAESLCAEAARCIEQPVPNN